MDFTGVFDFQLFLYQEKGWPKDSVTKWKVGKPEKMSDFLSRMLSSGLKERICIDMGDLGAASFEGVAYEREKLVIQTSGDSDVDDFERLRMSPEKLEIIVDKDPRLSYLALNPEYGIEIDGLPKNKRRFALFYPHGSLLMTKKYRTNVLASHGLGELRFEDTPIPDSFSKGYLENILKRINTKVFPRLKKHYGNQAAAYGLTLNGYSTPEEFSRGKVQAVADEALMTFYMDVTKKMKKRDVEMWIEKFFTDELPFPVEALGDRMTEKRMVVRLLAEIPE